MVYYQHVKAFPRYISATHSLCEDIEKRKILLENLNDEENRDADHPKLWKNFALAVDADAEEEAEVYEIVIKGKTYYVQNEKDGPIYEADADGEISLEVDIYKNGKPTFF